MEHPGGIRGASRRTVLRRSAWAAPAVVLVTAAPAFAVTPAATALRFEYLSAYGADWGNPGPRALEVGTSLQNTFAPGSPSVADIIVTLDFPADRVADAPATITGPGGWTFTGTSTPRTGVIRFTFAFPGPVANTASTINLVFTVSLVPGGSGPIAITTTGTADGAAPATRSDTAWV